MSPAQLGETNYCLNLEKLDFVATAKIAQGVEPFKLTLEALGSFTTSLCFGVSAPQQQLLFLRQALRAVAFDANAQVDDIDYLPHLTVGLYRDVFSTRVIASEIRTCDCPHTEPFSVESIALARYATDTIKGPFEILKRFPLGG